MILILFGILGLFFGIVCVCSVNQTKIDKVAEHDFNSKTGGVVKNNTEKKLRISNCTDSVKSTVSSKKAEVVKRNSLDQTALNMSASDMDSDSGNNSYTTNNSRISRELYSMDSDRINTMATFYNNISTADYNRTLSSQTASTAKFNFSTTNLPEIDMDFKESASDYSLGTASATDLIVEDSVKRSLVVKSNITGLGVVMSVDADGTERITDGDLYG